MSRNSPIDHTGRVFTRLTAIRWTGEYYSTKGGNKKRVWEFLCSCGKTCKKPIEKVVKGHVKSCGCLKTTRTSLETLQYGIYCDSYKDGDLTFDQFIYLCQQDCFWCGAKPSNTRAHRTKKDLTYVYNGLDRIDNGRPHDEDNVVPSCWKCNCRRGNTPFAEYMNWISTLYHRHLELDSGVR